MHVLHLARLRHLCHTTFVQVCLVCINVHCGVWFNLKYLTSTLMLIKALASAVHESLPIAP